jgi:hypothetical protein
MIHTVIGPPEIIGTRIMVVTKTEIKITGRIRIANTAIGLRSIIENTRGMREEEAIEEATGIKTGMTCETVPRSKMRRRRVHQATRRTVLARGIVQRKIVATMKEAKKYVSEYSDYFQCSHDPKQTENTIRACSSSGR